SFLKDSFCLKGLYNEVDKSFTQALCRLLLSVFPFFLFFRDCRATCRRQHCGKQYGTDSQTNDSAFSHCLTRRGF
ncbi:hypothetical protein, partial [uncultured Victivallis sp.]|uniref:hypothetical protein n=1 Tax=uncultured Victivallis sp. TaxID=354118 RepID=UPI0025940D7C